MLKRVHYQCEELDAPKKQEECNCAQCETGLTEAAEKKYPDKQYVKTKPEGANLVTSKLDYIKGNLHAPALDIDFPVDCYESSTPGHYHVLIDVPMPWWKYRILMWWMSVCGIIERGYYKASVRRKGSYLRKQGIWKEDSEKNKDNPEDIEQQVLSTINNALQNQEELIYGIQTQIKNLYTDIDYSIDEHLAIINENLQAIQGKILEEDEDGEQEADPNIEMAQDLWQHWT